MKRSQFALNIFPPATLSNNATTATNICNLTVTKIIMIFIAVNLEDAEPADIFPSHHLHQDSDDHRSHLDLLLCHQCKGRVQ